MTPSRRTAVTYRKLVAQNGVTTDVDGAPMLVLGEDTQVTALASLRAMPIPPSPAGAPDGPNDDVDPVAYRKAKNARKRERRARK